MERKDYPINQIVRYYDHILRVTTVKLQDDFETECNYCFFHNFLSRFCIENCVCMAENRADRTNIIFQELTEYEAFNYLNV